MERGCFPVRNCSVLLERLEQVERFRANYKNTLSFEQGWDEALILRGSPAQLAGFEFINQVEPFHPDREFFIFI